MTKIKKTENANCYSVYGATGTLIYYWWETKMVKITELLY